MREPAPSLAHAEASLRAAEVLLREGLHRDAASRAYYAMFRAGRALLASKDLHPRTHGGVLQQIGKHFVQPGLLDREVAEDLGYALQLRQRADYDDDLAVTEVDARGLVERATRFVRVVREALGAS